MACYRLGLHPRAWEPRYGIGVGEIVPAAWHYRLAAESVSVWEAGFCVPRGADRRVRGWLFLALLPEALESACQQSHIREAQAAGEQTARPGCDTNVACAWLARSPGLGTRARPQE